MFRQNGAGWTLVAYWEGSATGGDFAHAGGRVYVGSGTFQMTVWCNIGDKEFPSDSVIKTN
ncbi:MAG: hypothetical protein IJ438_05965 [Clostridia bacterium]|nr:hypothetical protein [Clostridia bacterium]